MLFRSWEPRIQIESVDVGPDASQPETAVATVTYRLVATAARERISLNVPLSTT